VLGGNLVIWVAGVAVGLMLLAIGWMAPRRVIHFFMSFLAIQSVLNALFDLKALFVLSVFEENRLTDARNMAAATRNLLPAPFWAVAWGAMALAILGWALFIYYKSLVGSRASKQPAVNFDDLIAEQAIGVSSSSPK